MDTPRRVLSIRDPRTVREERVGQPDSGDVLAADLYALLEVAKDELPSVS